MLISVFGNYVFGILTEKTIQKKSMVFLSIIFNLSILIFFKYTNFLVDIFSDISKFNVGIPKIIMPIGISFYTFQSMSYVFDIYFGKAKAQKNPFNVLLYVCLFPQLVAGPIVRYETIENEIENRNENEIEISDGISLFIIGLAKKILIANEVGIIADNAFNDPSLNVLYAWLGIIAYALQIYFDFSAYSDMAIGLGKIFGFHFPKNFNYPYIADSITDFWRRWHISLSTWFRDYIYIPLGGNRCSKYKHLRNIMIVWLLTGVWHGAGWNFIIWGVYYGILLIVEKEFLMSFLNKTPKIFRHFYTLFIVLIGFVFFRADNLSKAIEYLKTMFGFAPLSGGNEIQLIRNNFIILIIAMLFSTPFCMLFKNIKYKAAFKFIFCIIIFLVSIIYLTSSTFNPFIYFRF